MRNVLSTRALALCLLAAASATTTACNAPGSSDDASGGTAAEEPTPNPPGSTQVAYPSGPYGVGVGAIVEDYSFSGFQDHQTTPGSLQTIALADFYNPNGDDASPSTDPAKDSRYFPPGSLYGAGSLKPRVLMIDVSSVWCGPCNEEAGLELPSLYKTYRPCGGEFLLQLADSATPGVPATPQDLTNWTTKYGVSYPATIDPTSKLSALFQAATFPASLMIDLRTMKILDVATGIPPQAFWQRFEAELGPNPGHDPAGVPASTACTGSNTLPF